MNSKTIRIARGKDGTLMKLKQLLNLVDQGEKLNWSLLWLEGIGKLSPIPMLSFENEINLSPSGYKIIWADLVKFSEQVDQIVDILFVGDYLESNVKRYEFDVEMRASCLLTCELFDSSYWLISSSNALIIDKIKGSLDPDMFVTSYVTEEEL